MVALVVGAGRLGELFVYQGGGFLVDSVRNVLPALTPTELFFAVALFQTGYDAQDAENHAPFLYRDPISLGSSARSSVLLIEGIGTASC